MSKTAAPYVGLPTLGEGCAFAPNVDDPACDALPTSHLRAESEWGTVGMLACDRHRSIARVAGLVTSEHAFGESCAGDNYWGHWDGA
jgi:hypothetical protein